MTDKVRCKSRCDWTFSKEVTKCRLLFFEKIRFEDFWKTGRNENSDRWDRVRNYILSGGCTEGGALCAGNAKGRQLHAGVKGQSPLSGQGWNALPSDLMPASSRTGYYLANCVTQNHFRGWPPHEKKHVKRKRQIMERPQRRAGWEKRKMKKCRMDERGNQKNESYKA